MDTSDGIKKIFYLLDTDGDGKISMTDIIHVNEELKVTEFTKDKLTDMYKKISESKDIDLKLFTEIYKKNLYNKWFYILNIYFKLILYLFFPRMLIYNF